MTPAALSKLAEKLKALGVRVVHFEDPKTGVKLDLEFELERLVEEAPKPRPTNEFGVDQDYFYHEGRV